MTASARGSRSRPPSTRRHAPAEARRVQILEGALLCFSEKGYHAATMDDVARAAGLSKGSLYWHFASKEEVFLAVGDAFSLELFGAWREEVARHRGDVRSLLGRLGELLIEQVTAHEPMVRAWAEILTHRQAQERFAGIYAESRRFLTALIEDGIERGEIATTASRSLAACLTALVEGLLLQHMVDPGFEPLPHWRDTWRVIDRGLRP